MDKSKINHMTILFLLGFLLSIFLIGLVKLFLAGVSIKDFKLYIYLVGIITILLATRKAGKRKNSQKTSTRP